MNFRQWLRLCFLCFLGEDERFGENLEGFGDLVRKYG